MDILEKYLRNNRKLEVEFLNDNGITEGFQTGFYSIEKDKYILYKPQSNISVKDNQKIKVLIYTNSGIFTFDTTVISSSSKLIKTEKPKEYKRVQRRENLRESLTVPFVLELSQDNKQNFKTQNISGGGFSFYCDEIFDKSKNYFVELLFEERKIKSKVKIIEIRKNNKPKPAKYRYSMQLLSLNKQDEDYIIKKCLVKNIKTINI